MLALFSALLLPAALLLDSSVRAEARKIDPVASILIAQVATHENSSIGLQFDRVKCREQIIIRCEQEARIKRTVERTVGKQASYGRPGCPIDRRESPRNDNFSVRLNCHSMDIARWNVRIERVVERTVRIEPGQSRSRNTVVLRKVTPDQNLAAWQDDDFLDESIRAGAFLKARIQTSIRVEPIKGHGRPAETGIASAHHNLAVTLPANRKDRAEVGRRIETRVESARNLSGSGQQRKTIQGSKPQSRSF